MTDTNTTDRGIVLAGLLLAVHVLVNVGHSVAHLRIPVFLDAGPNVAVLLAHFVLPVAGVVLLWRGRVRLGAATFGVSMAAAFALGLALHFLVPNPDNVAALPAGPWHGPFELTALAFLPVDAAGALLGGWLWWRAVNGAGDPPRTGRLAGISGTEAGPLTRFVYRGARRQLGQVPESLTVTAHSGNILAGTTAFEVALDRADRVDNRLTELAVLKTATLVGCEFCIDLGSAEARDLGITETQLRALPAFGESDAFTERERLVMHYAEAMTATPTRVPDELFDALAREFDEAELVELTAAIAFENYRARFNGAFGIKAQGFSEGEFCPLPAEPTVDRAGSVPDAY